MKQDTRLRLCTVADVGQVTFQSEHNRYKQLILETSVVLNNYRRNSFETLLSEKYVRLSH